MQNPNKKFIGLLLTTRPVSGSSTTRECDRTTEVRITAYALAFVPTYSKLLFRGVWLYSSTRVRVLSIQVYSSTALFMYSFSTRSLGSNLIYTSRCGVGTGVWCTRQPSQTDAWLAGSPSRRTPATPCAPTPPRRCCAPPRLCQARGSPARVRAQGSSTAASAPPTPLRSSGRGPRTPVRP
jgi:hypothetical protein